MSAVPWPLLTDPFTAQVSVGDTPDPGAEQASGAEFLGRGILRPLRRDQKLDFANATGARLVAASVGQILGTQCDSEHAAGELPWRTEFGSKLYLLRQRLNSNALVEQARRFVADAIKRWEPRVRITETHITRGSAPTGGTLNMLVIRVKYNFVDQNSGTNAVLARDLESSVTLGS